MNSSYERPSDNRVKVIGYATTEYMAALCLANANGDVDQACALVREHVPVRGDRLERLLQAIRQAAAA